jgi:hypothetical protein
LYFSHGRIPVSQLSINRLNSCYSSNENHIVTSILEILDFPDYMVICKYVIYILAKLVTIIK